jgi:WD40 repeat protein
MSILDLAGKTVQSGLRAPKSLSAVDFDPRSGTVFVGSENGLVTSISSQGQRVERKIAQNDVEKLSVSRDGKTLLVASGMSVHLVDLSEGGVVDFDTSVCQSPPMLEASGTSFLCATSPQAIARFDLDTPRPKLIEHHDFSSVGYVIPGPVHGMFAVTSEYGGGFQVFFPEGPHPGGPFFGGEAGRVAFMPDGARVVEIGWLDTQLKVFDLKGPAIETEDIDAGTDLSALTFCADGSLRLGAFDGRVGIVTSGSKVVFVKAHHSPVRRIACLPGGRTISSGDDGLLLVSEDGSATPIAKIEDPPFRFFDPLPDGTGVLASRGREVWQVGYDGSYRRLFTSQLEDIWRLAVLNNGNLILLASSGAGYVEVRKINGDVVTAPFHAHVGIVNAVKPLWTDDRLVTGGTLGTSNMLSLSVWALSGKLQSTVRAHTAILQDIAVDYHAELIATAGDDKTVQLWDGGLARVGPPIIRTDAFVAALAISPDRRKLAAVSGTRLYVAHYSPEDLIAKACTRLLARRTPPCSEASSDIACSACGEGTDLHGSEKN